MEKEVIKLKKEVRKFYKANDPAHDFSHVERVLKTAEIIGKKEHAELGILLPAVLLHDVKKPVKKAIPVAWQILRKLKYDKKQIAEILHAIETHSFTHAKKPKSLEAKILQDSDRLDALGAIGVARTFTVGGGKNRAMYNAQDAFCARRSPDDLNYTVDHFYRKLLTLKSGLHTKAAKKIADKRHKFLLEFLSQLRSELA